MILAVATLGLALAGLIDMFYASTLHYGWFGSGAPAATFCSPYEAGGCNTTFQSPQALVFGLPISVYGMGYYTLISLAATSRLITGHWTLRPLVIGMVFAAAGVSLYLAWMLIFSIGEFCKLCFFGHTVNLFMAGLFTAALIHGYRHPEQSQTIRRGLEWQN